MVRIYPDKDSASTTKFVCDCADAHGPVYLAYVDDEDVCIHIKAVREVDDRKFRVNS